MEHCKHQDFFQTLENYCRNRIFETMYRNEDLSYMWVFEWFKRCRGGCDDLEPWHGWLSTAQNLETVKRFFEPVAGDHWITLRLL
jgi:hypothetical protein